MHTKNENMEFCTCGYPLRRIGPLAGSCAQCDVTSDHVDRRKAEGGDEEAQKRVEFVRGARIRLGLEPDPFF